MQESVARTRTASVPKRTKTPKRKKVRRLLFFLCLFLILAGGGAIAAFYWKLDRALDTVTLQPDGETLLGAAVDPTYHADKPMSIVILGRDTRKETGSLNTDVMIVSVVNPETKQVTMLSLPRDTRVKIPGYKNYHKINSVFADGESERRQAEVNGQPVTETGISLTKKTLEQVLGIPINHYVEVDFDGFKAMIDELGGVDVTVDRKLVYDDPTDDTHIHLEEGPQHLNGEQALGYVRHRHDNRGVKYYSNDFDRNRRQQEVIKAIVDKMTTVDGFTKVFSVIDVASQHIHTDLSKEQIKGLVYDFKSVSSSNLHTLETGAYWVASESFTLLPKEKRDEIRGALLREMKLDSAVTELNDSPFDNIVTTTKSTSTKKRSKKASAASSSKQVEPKTSEPATPPVQPEQQEAPLPGTEEQPTDGSAPADPSTDPGSVPSQSEQTPSDPAQQSVQDPTVTSPNPVTPQSDNPVPTTPSTS